MAADSVSGKEVASAFVWLFAALSLVALLSPPGATHDEAYHMRSIWCGHGERAVYCSERFRDETGALVARTNIEIMNCQKSIREPLLCPTDRSEESIFRTNDGLYPGLFYFALSWLVLNDVDFSVALMRVASVSLIVVMLGLLMWLLPPRCRVVHFLVCLTGFSATGYFLFASINPSSWTAFGVGFGWLPVHAVLAPNQLSQRRRLALISIALVAWIMAVGSRSDGLPFVIFTLVAALSHAGWLRYPNKRQQLFTAVTSLVILAIAILETASSFSPLANFKSLYTFADGQRDNLAFFSENLLQSAPNAINALGTMPTMSGIALPEIVLIVSLLLLGYYGVRAFNHEEKFQIIGAVVTLIVIAAVVMAQISLVDFRDSGGVEPRYVFPLTLFALGWWFLLGPKDLFEKVQKSLRVGSVVVVIIFLLTVLTVAERFVDVQTSGLRYLPEGLDQWWWGWMPVGPNVTVILAVMCLARFFQQSRRTLLVDERALVC